MKIPSYRAVTARTTKKERSHDRDPIKKAGGGFRSMSMSGKVGAPLVSERSKQRGMSGTMSATTARVPDCTKARKRETAPAGAKFKILRLGTADVGEKKKAPRASGRAITTQRKADPYAAERAA